MSKWYIAFLVLFFSAWLPAAVILTENFDTNAAWSSLGQDTIENGRMVLRSPDAQSRIGSLNNTVIPADFSLTVESAMSDIADSNGHIIDPNAHIGVIFRMQDDTDSYQFCVYPNQSYKVVKYMADSLGAFQSTVLSKGRQLPHSFVNPVNNRLKIICQGSRLSFLCNGQLLIGIADTAITGAGKVGLIAAGKITGSFDNLVIDDAPVADPGLLEFRDSFADPMLPGWANYRATDTFQVSNGKLRCIAAQTSSAFATLVSDGNYGPWDTLSVTTEKVESPLSGAYIYGLQYHYSRALIDTFLVPQGYIFCIINSTYFTVLKIGSGITQLFVPQMSAFINQNTPNTLKVACGAGGRMELFINDSLMKTITDNSYPSGGTGLVASNGAIIDFSQFSATQTLNAIGNEKAFRAAIVSLRITAHPNPFNARTLLGVSGNPGAPFMLAVYDVRGRRLEKWENQFPATVVFNAGALTPGVYFARLISGEQTITHRLIQVR